MAVTGARRQAAAQTEAELKAAAIRVFARVGYLNTKITDITAEAGRATGSFYKHFASKERLLEALLADLLAEGDVSAGLPGHNGDFRDRSAVRWHVALFWGFYRRNRAVMTALSQAAIVDEEFARRSREMLEPDLHHIAGHLVGLDVPGDPMTAASLFSATLSGYAAAYFAGPAELSEEAAIEALTSFLHAGLGGRSA
ncbi:TetR/AcrR family transcriptional regulator [Actinoplanes sp. NBRC 101535]|uniref:TetR/AcrR family transcriptional regulator n=1 Tax=Actinoplanes sp. NBRC 101535 TaxID=3032196 RepID=UPI0024A50F2A|nr:TetR/AcrR family transcriptional regulator [Actinoplanes sp. NBRC 101535]GLY01844.1 TetR family transcriptional regulator [Actinoplanes sp. NBRC 101535]